MVREWKGAPAVVMEPGKRYTIKGRFQRYSSFGFADDRGLFEFVAYHPLDKTGRERPEWVYPPGAPCHPRTIQMQEAEERELAEQAARERAHGRSKKQ